MVARSALGQQARTMYVSTAHTARDALQRTHLLDRLDEKVTPGRFSVATHLRSMLSVYDAVELTRLDLPWWTYPATTAVELHLATLGGRARVFEYGAGASTVWLRKRAGEVISVENDAEFLTFIEPLLAESPGEGKVLCHEIDRSDPEHGADRYVHAIDDVPGEFDLIVVDGRERVRCALASLPRLAEGGIVLLDDSQRRRYRPALSQPGTRVTEYRGLVPTLPIPRRTALIRRTG